MKKQTNIKRFVKLYLIGFIVLFGFTSVSHTLLSAPTNLKDQLAHEKHKSLLHKIQQTSPISIGTLNLKALLVEDGEPIEKGLTWRVYAPAKNTNDLPEMKEKSSEAKPQFRLPEGDYFINVAYGQAFVTQKVTVKSDAPGEETFVLNAGGLKIGSVEVNGKPVELSNVHYDIYTAELDQYGKRKLAVSKVRPGLVVRLNEGIYHIVSTYGDVNASSAADVTIKAGKMTEATVNHHAAHVTFKLLTEQGGEALANVTWELFDHNKKMIKKSVGALPAHFIAEGKYLIVAERGGKSFEKAFEIKTGERKKIDLIALGEE